MESKTDETDERPRVVIDFEGQKVTFWLTANLTFGQLLTDACYCFGLAPSRATLCDPTAGAYYPASGNVLEVQRAFGRHKLRVQLQTRDQTVLASSLEASGVTGVTPPESPRLVKAPVRLSFYADECQQSTEVLPTGSIRMPRMVGAVV